MYLLLYLIKDFEVDLLLVVWYFTVQCCHSDLSIEFCTSATSDMFAPDTQYILMFTTTLQDN